jgi:hypothetical protein
VYGPPPDPRQVLVELTLAEHGLLIALCVALGLALSGLFFVRRLPEPARVLAFVLGQVIALTSPLFLVLDRWVLGSYPTIDKAGSLLFYLDGVHQRLTLQPVESLTDPAARLIGVHVGHLWITQVFDLVLQPFGAMNAQGMLWMVLGWLFAALFVREVSTHRDWGTALTLGFPFGMGLHVLRDLNWYTIEKVAVGLLALFAFTTLKALREGGRWRLLAGLAYALMAWINWYLALVGACSAALALLIQWLWGARQRQRPSSDLLLACLASAICALPLVLLQLALLSGEGTLGDPEAFLYERAMLDSFELWPPRWNRLELWRAVNLPFVGLGLYALRRRDPLLWGMGALAGLLLLLALGPMPFEGVWNPVYMGLRELVPGFWRIAKPEVFFEGSYLLLLAMASRALDRPLPRWLYPLLLIGWLWAVRSHPVYPGFSEFLPLELSEGWTQQVGL